MRGSDGVLCVHACFVVFCFVSFVVLVVCMEFGWSDGIRSDRRVRIFVVDEKYICD